jgi:lysozyme
MKSPSASKITATKRGKAAIAAVMLVAAAGAWNSFPTTQPPAVVLATGTLIKGWEGLVLESHWDRYARIWDICYGETAGHHGRA